ncbi:MAG: TPM domain-containing protein [Bacteroidetes bacterium]|nr:TPM domain-containing protein [Bacteroidota bacterium]MCW5896278.1 TPM domain-containing protein [Bacteroidota bacterium]
MPSGNSGWSRAFSQTQDQLAQEVPVPKLTRRVTDFTNTLSTAQVNALEADVARFEDSTSTQLVIVILPTIGGASIEEFALRIAEANLIGQKGTDNGILLLIAKDDRKLRIEVGYGLEGVLPDGLAGTIIRREITPHFRDGDYYAGIKAGAEAIILATRNEHKADKRKDDNEDTVGAIIIFLLLAFIILSALARGKRSRGLLGTAALPILFGGGHRGRSSGGTGWGGGGGGFGGFSGGGGSFGGGGSSGSW